MLLSLKRHEGPAADPADQARRASRDRRRRQRPATRTTTGGSKNQSIARLAQNAAPSQARPRPAPRARRSGGCAGAAHERRPDGGAKSAVRRSDRVPCFIVVTPICNNRRINHSRHNTLHSPIIIQRSQVSSHSGSGATVAQLGLGAVLEQLDQRLLQPALPSTAGMPTIIRPAGLVGDLAQQGVVALRILPFQLGHLDLDAAGEPLVVAFGHGQFQAIGALLQHRELARRSCPPGAGSAASVDRLHGAVGRNHFQRDRRLAASGCKRALVSCARTSTVLPSR